MKKFLFFRVLKKAEILTKCSYAFEISKTSKFGIFRKKMAPVSFRQLLPGMLGSTAPTLHYWTYMFVDEEFPKFQKTFAFSRHLHNKKCLTRTLQ